MRSRLKKSQRTAQEQQHATRNLQFVVVRTEQAHAMLGPHERRGDHGLKHVSKPQHHEQGHAGEQKFVGGVEHREAGHGHDGVGHGGQHNRGFLRH